MRHGMDEYADNPLGPFDTLAEMNKRGFAIQPGHIDQMYADAEHKLMEMAQHAMLHGRDDVPEPDEDEASAIPTIDELLDRLATKEQLVYRGWVAMGSKQRGYSVPLAEQITSDGTPMSAVAVRVTLKRAREKLAKWQSGAEQPPEPANTIPDVVEGDPNYPGLNADEIQVYVRRQDQKPAQIAREMDLPVKRVYTLLSSARKKMREE